MSPMTVVAFVLLWASLTLQYRIYLTGQPPKRLPNLKKAGDH